MKHLINYGVKHLFIQLWHLWPSRVSLDVYKGIKDGESNPGTRTVPGLALEHTWLTFSQQQWFLILHWCHAIPQSNLKIRLKTHQPQCPVLTC